MSGTAKMRRDAAAELRSAGAEILLVACTELSLIADSISRDITVVDTIEILAAAVVAFSSGAAPWGYRDDTGYEPLKSGPATWRHLSQRGSFASPRGVPTNCRSGGALSVPFRRKNMQPGGRNEG